MSSSTGSSFRWFLYFSYALVLTAVLLYQRFPTAPFKEYCALKIGRLFVGVECSIGRISYAFPLGLRFVDVAFAPPGQKKNPRVVLSSLSMAPVFSDIRQAVELRGTGYSGKFRAILRGAPGDKRFSLDALRILDIRLAEIKPLQDALGRELSGRVDISGGYSAEVGRYLDGKLEGKMMLREGKVALLQPILVLNTVDLGQMEMELKYDQRKLQISKGKMKGAELSADFSGTVNIISPWQLSQLAAAGDIALQAGFIKENPAIENEIRALKKQFKKTTIPFRMNGSLQKPTFRFGI